jgi:hypothetical protein
MKCSTGTSNVVGEERVQPTGDTEDLVFGFLYPHRVGTVCGFPCEQCGAKYLTDENGKRLPDTPLFIVAEATEEDWKASIKRRGGRNVPSRANTYFYVVRAD